ncbi:MAG: matrixin family metalloprotease [Deltaproteobacteria bacterium]|nr:matrixin family metalloprotease [Deltaproteobacteria bacterium]
MLGSLAMLSTWAASAFVPYTTDAGVPLRWEVGTTLELHVGVSPDGVIPVARVAAIADAAISVWLDAPCDPGRVDLRPDAIVVEDGGALDEDDGLVGLVWIADPNVWNQRYGTAELARTILIHRSTSGAIVDADIVVNYGRFEFAADEACAADRYDLASTLTHELGHVLGLDHSDVAAATMARSADPGECDKRSLDPDDVAGICASYTTPARPEPAPEPSPEPAPEAPAEVVESEPTHGGRDEGCAGGPTPLPIALVVALALSSARRASAGCRPARRPSRARS